MAYAEKRGNGPRPWRVKYKRPDGREVPESGFETKTEALNWGRDQESLIRHSSWIDPKLGEITLKAWINDHWWPAQRLGINTLKNYRLSIDKHILPEFGGLPIASLGHTQINQWENRKAKTAPAAAKKARDLLVTILGDAVFERRIGHNPAARQKTRRGRQVKQTTAPEELRPTLTPLQVLLFAERAGLARSEMDFIWSVLLAYTGLRWGEMMGMQPKSRMTGLIRLRTQLLESGGRCYPAQIPKSGSRRDIDIPVFLDALLDRLTPRKCRCKGGDPHPETGDPRCPGGLIWLFLGPKGGHLTNSVTVQRVMDPAADAVWPKGSTWATKAKALPVLVDLAAGWPGVPLRPSTTPYSDAQLETAAYWEPVHQGLHPHWFRHTHRTWMDEDRVPDVLKRARLGHDRPGEQVQRHEVADGYSHPTLAMAAELKMLLETRWERSLRERAALDPHSPLPLLDELLTPYRTKGRKEDLSGREVDLPNSSQLPHTP